MSDYRPAQFNLLPEVVKNLLIINGLFFLGTLAAQNFGIDLLRILGLHYIHSEYFSPYQFVTHMFMHGSFLHIFSNMFALWMFGTMLENFWGGKRFLIFYFFTGLGAALIHSGVSYYEIHTLEKAADVYLNNPGYESFKVFVDGNISATPTLHDFINDWAATGGSSAYYSEAEKFVNMIVRSAQNVPTVGASGAVFGVLLAFGMLFPNTVLYIYFFLPLKAKYFVIIYAAFELYAGYQSIQGNMTTNIAHFAHLGGMLFGFILIKYWQKNSRRFY